MLNEGFEPKATAAPFSGQSGDLHTKIREAAARGYQHDANSEKEMDVDLLDAICEEIERAVIQFLGNVPSGYAGPVGNPATGLVTTTNNPSNQPVSALNPITMQLGDRYRSDMATTGPSDFLRHPDTGHIIGVEQAPSAVTAEPTHDADGNPAQYPKWVAPHESWVEQDASGRPMAPLLGEPHVDRRNQLTVYVASKEEEDRVMAQRPSDKDTPELPSDAVVLTPNAGIGGGDETGAKTLYPAGTEQAENADKAGFAERSALMSDDEVIEAEEKRLKEARKNSDARRAAADKAKNQTTK